MEEEARVIVERAVGGVNGPAQLDLFRTLIQETQ